MMIRQTKIKMAIRVTGTGAPLNTIRGNHWTTMRTNNGNFHAAIKSPSSSSIGAAVNTTRVGKGPSSNRQSSLSEKLFHSLLQSPSIDFRSDMDQYLRTYSTASATNQISRLLPDRRVLEQPLDGNNNSSPHADAHRRKSIRYLLIHHDCNPTTLPSFSPRRSSVATRLLLYCSVCPIAQLGNETLQQRWDRIELGADDAQVMIIDPNMEGTDTLCLLKWIADACGHGCLDKMLLDETCRLHIPAIQLYRVLQLVVRSDKDDDETRANIMWLLDQTIAVRNAEYQLPRQHPTSKCIDLVGGRVNWTSLVYDQKTRSIIETSTERGNATNRTHPAMATLRRLSASFGKVSQDILHWHANGNIRKLEDFVKMVCEEIQFADEKPITNVPNNDGIITEAEQQTIYLLGVFGAIAVDGNRGVSSKQGMDNNGVGSATSQVQEAFSSILQTKPLLYWGELLHEHILTTSRMTMHPSITAKMVMKLLRPSSLQSPRHHHHTTTTIPSTKSRLESRVNAETSLYLELLAQIDPLVFLKEQECVQDVIVHSSEGAAAIMKALILQFVLSGPSEISHLKSQISNAINGKEEEGMSSFMHGFLHFGLLTTGIATSGHDVPRELSTAFGYLSPLLSLEDGTLTRWATNDDEERSAKEPPLNSVISVRSSSAATLLLGRQHRSITIPGLTRVEDRGIGMPLVSITKTPQPNFIASLWKIDIAKLLIKSRTDVFVNTSNDIPKSSAKVAARINFKFSDEQLVVLSKPAEMSSSLFCPSPAPKHTVVDNFNIVSSLLGPLHASIQSTSSTPRSVRVFNELGLLNRLDAHTTGVMIAVLPREISSTPSPEGVPSFDTFKYVSTCANILHTLQKKYFAFVHHHTLKQQMKPGAFQGAHDWLIPSGVISTYVPAVGNRPWGGGGQSTTKDNSHLSSSQSLFISGPIDTFKNSKNATTKYRVVRSFPASKGYLVELTLTSGRRHQIRQHMASIGFPLFGDVLYGGVRDTSLIRRTALHASSISIPLPRREGEELGEEDDDSVTIEIEGDNNTVGDASTIPASERWVRVTRSTQHSNSVTVAVALPKDMRDLLATLESRERKSTTTTYNK